MKLNTGKVAFPIEFDNGDKDYIYFNPSDPEFATRLMAVKDNVGKRIEALKFEDFELSNSGEIPEIKTVEDVFGMSEEQSKEMCERAEKISRIIEDTKRIIYDEINIAFDSDVSSVVFKHCSPFAIVNGEYFILQFLTAIIPEIQKKTKKISAEAEKKMAKHIGKYVQ